jgi:hypothetical protein
MSLISPQQLITLRKNMKYSKKEMADIFDIEEDEWHSWELGEASPNTHKIGKILLSLFFKGKLFFCSSKNNEIMHSLTKARHFNEKLSESAMGADETLHQCIDDEINNVINFIK